MSDLLLEIKDVTKVFRIGGVLLGTEFLAVDHVSLSLDKHLASERTRRLLGWAPSRTDILRDIESGSYATRG